MSEKYTEDENGGEKVRIEAGDRPEKGVKAPYFQRMLEVKRWQADVVSVMVILMTMLSIRLVLSNKEYVRELETQQDLTEEAISRLQECVSDSRDAKNTLQECQGEYHECVGNSKRFRKDFRECKDALGDAVAVARTAIRKLKTTKIAFDESIDIAKDCQASHGKTLDKMGKLIKQLGSQGGEEEGLNICKKEDGNTMISAAECGGITLRAVRDERRGLQERLDACLNRCGDEDPVDSDFGAGN